MVCRHLLCTAIRNVEMVGYVQVPTSKLPPYRDVLEPLLPLDGAKPIHTRDFKDGQRIPTLSELLEAVRPKLAVTLLPALGDLACKHIFMLSPAATPNFHPVHRATWVAR